MSNSGDISGSSLCYKDGPKLPPLNFSTVCIEHGRYVIFYNERLDGVIYPDGYELLNVYTEMCEVIIQGTLLSLIFFLFYDFFEIYTSFEFCGSTNPYLKRNTSRQAIKKLLTLSCKI